MMLTDAERREFERLEDEHDIQGLAWRVDQLLAEHLARCRRADCGTHGGQEGAGGGAPL